MRTREFIRALALAAAVLAIPQMSAAQGVLANGATYTGAASVAGEIDQWTFTANQGDYLIVRAGEIPVSPGTPDPGFWPWIRILGTTGSVIASATGNTDAEAAVAAPLSGTYTVLVGAYYPTATGSYRLTLAKGPGGFQTSGGDEGGAMTNGLRHAGRIEVGDLDMWSFDADQNDTVVVRIGEVPVGAGQPDPGFWPWIRVIGTNGAVLDTSTGDLDAEATFRAPLTGTYTVVVGAYYAGASNDYLLNLAMSPAPFQTDQNDQGGAMTNGLRHTGAIGLGDLDLWSFDAEQNDTFVIRAGEIPVGPGVADPGFWPWVRVVGPTGAVVGQATGDTDAETSFRATLSGTYTVIVAAYYGGATGDYRVALAKAPGSFQTAGGDDGAAMTNGTRYSGRIDVGDLDMWSFTATQGHTAVVRIGEIPVGAGTPDPGYWPWIRVVSPAGVVVGQSTGNTDAEATFTAPLTGTYTVIAAAYYGGAAGDYRLSYATFGAFQTSGGDEGGALANDVAQTGDIDLGDLDLWSFSACQGNTVVVTLSEIPVGPGTPDPGFWPWLRVIGPAGTVVAQSTGDLVATSTFTAPATGAYTIVAAAYYAGATGDYTVKVVGACTPAPITPVSGADSYSTAFNTPLVVPPPGVMANDVNVAGATVAVVSAVSTGSLALNANGGFTYTPPTGFSGPATFTYRATNSAGPGTVATVTITVQPAPTAPVATDDAYTANSDQTLTVAAPGVLGNDAANGGGALTAVLVSPPTRGGVTLNANGGLVYTPNAGYVGPDAFTYRASNANGFSNVATVAINVVSTTTPPTVPSNLYAWAIFNNVVTLRWNAPTSGPAPSGYVIDGGVAPGAPIVSFPTNRIEPIAIFAAPTGSFYVRVRAIVNGQLTDPSNEIPIHVSVPVRPSAPSGLTGTVNGSQVELSWMNTHGGGFTQNAILDVSGSYTGSFNLGPTETFTFNGVPGGSYTFSVRGANAAGASPSSNAVTLTFPQPCTGAPLTPERFLAVKTGSLLTAVWETASSGNATTAFLLNVSGAFNGQVPIPLRALNVPVPPGSYTLSVAAVNTCGASPATAPITVTIP
jgi:Bacterial Ig domain